MYCVSCSCHTLREDELFDEKPEQSNVSTKSSELNISLSASGLNDIVLASESTKQKPVEMAKVSSNPMENGKPEWTKDDHQPDFKKSRFRAFIYRLVRPCLKSENPLPPEPTRGEKFRYCLQCPPEGFLGRLITLVVLLLLVWGVGIGMAGDTMYPGGAGFALLALFVIGIIIGALVKPLSLPPLLGMLVAGVVCRNIPGLKETVGEQVDKHTSGLVRNIALVVILTRAGLHMDPHSVRKVGIIVVLLAVLPPVAEAFAAAAASFLLIGFSFPWGMLLGFVLSAVSPAVVVPSFLKLQEQGYGVTKGIPTLGIAASSLNDAASITGFGIAFGIAFPTGDLTQTIIQGPLEILFAFVWGFVGGSLAWYIPCKTDGKIKLFRFMVLLGCGLLSMFGFEVIGYGGAGALGVLIFTCVASYGWKRHNEKAHHAISVQFAVMWAVFQPLLFSLIGSEIDISSLEPSTVANLLAILAIGLTARVIVAVIVLHGFTVKERIFMGFSWTPKATVQAAIGPMALDYVHRMQNATDLMETQAQQVLTIAVLAIIFTAPLGAVWIAFTGPRLLPRVSLEARKSICIAMQAKREGVVLVSTLTATGEKQDPEAYHGLPSPPSISSELNMMAEEEEAIQNVHSTIM